ncbi:MAG: hypothetical protein ACTHJL_13300 [Amnibacterium sp.]
MEVLAYVLAAGAMCVLVVLVGLLLVGLNAAFTVALHRRGAIDDDRADRLFRVRSVTLTVLGLVCLLPPVQPMVTGRGLEAPGAGLLTAGVLLIAGGIVAHSFFSRRIERRRR